MFRPNMCKLVLGFLLSCQFALYAGIDRELSVPVLMQGPAAAASVEDISSAYVNPAALTRLMNTEFIINFDSMYSFNTLVLAHYYSGFGNVALGFYRDPESKSDMSTLAYGGKIFRRQGKKLRQEISFGFNASIINQKEMNRFSSTVGGLYAVRKDWGAFRGFYLGLSTSGLLEDGTDPHIMTGIGLSYMLPNTHAWNISYGHLFNTRLGHRYWSFMTELQIYKPVYVTIGARNDHLAFGLSYKNINDFIYSGLLYSLLDNKAEFAVTYRRMILDSKKELPRSVQPVRSVGNKKAATVKQPQKTVTPVNNQQEVTEELLSQQRDLLREGLDLYGVKQVAKAVEKWKQVIELNATTEYGIQAESYIQTVQEDINGMLGK